MSKTAVITGASRGIGLAICRELLVCGYSIAGISRNMNFDEEINRLAEEKGLTLLPISADISKVEDHVRIVKTIKSEFGKVDVLVNNAGVAPEQRTDVLDMSVSSYQRVMDINLFGPVFFTQRMYSLLSGPEQSYIVFIGSVSANAASNNRAEYCISKAGLSMFSKLMSNRLAAESTNVFEIQPGVIETDMIEPVKERYERLLDDGLVPKGRLGQPEDIAKALRALVSGDFDYAHGSVIEISGGMQIRNL